MKKWMSQNWQGFSLGILCAIVILSNLNLSQIAAADDNQQLSTHDVLQIIAVPLPTGATNGYYLPKVNLENTFLDVAQFRFVNLSFAKLHGVSLKGADLYGAILRGVDLSEAQLDGADLTNTYLLEANLENANLPGAILNHANFEDADLKSANFTIASLSNSNLSGANIENVKFSGANLEGDTLPDDTIYKAGDDLVKQFKAASNP
jgi:uncharacterized protein YjbI with pentapeptide repeats